MTRALDPALQAHLDSGVTTLCDAWVLTRRDGLRMGFTDHDQPLTVDGVRCEPGGVDGGAVESALGLAADNGALLGALSAAAIAAEDVAAGLWDDAEAVRWRVNWRAPTQAARLFQGRFGAITTEGAAFRVELLGPAEALNRPLGRAYMALCDARLGDARCGVDLARPDRRAEAAVAELTADGRLRLDAPALPAGALAHGSLAWLDGAAAGARSAVLADVADARGRRLTLAGPPPPGAAVGDRVRAEVGCDRTAATCAGRYGNIAAFRGFPHVPGDDWLTGQPAPGGGHDGGRRGV